MTNVSEVDNGDRMDYIAGGLKDFKIFHQLCGRKTIKSFIIG
jgi:hypothetical protein